MRKLWCKLCYHAVHGWPFSIYGWHRALTWRGYLRLLPWAGEEAYRRGEL